MKTTKGYSPLQIGVHWVTALLIGLQYLSSDAMEAAFRAVLNGRANDSSVAQIHTWSGVAVLALVVLRLGMRFWRGVPDTPAGSSPRMEQIGEWTHWSILGLLVLVPVSGLLAWGAGIALAGGVHGLLVNMLLALVLLHAAAALYHQYFLRDGLIRRMLHPG